MSPVIDCTTEQGSAEGVEAAAEAVRSGLVVVLPTDTVYGVGADAFDTDAVAAVLAAKGRGREMPLPVLVPKPETVDGLAANVPTYARDLMDAFWPGPLTLVLHSQGSLMWDLGETNGTVALRMPRNDVALRLLTEVGPMAVTSANVSGHPPANSILDAASQLGSAVSVYLDAGPSAGGLASTIVDCTRDSPAILRAGAVSADQIQQILGDVTLHDPMTLDPEPLDPGPLDPEPLDPEPVDPEALDPEALDDLLPPTVEPSPPNEHTVE